MVKDEPEHVRGSWAAFPGKIAELCRVIRS